MKTNLLDTFLKRHGITRYRLSKLAGISQNTLKDYTEKSLNKYTVSFLRSLSFVTGESVTDVLLDLAEIEQSYDDLAGFKHLLDKYKLSFPMLEFELYSIIKEFESANIEISPFTFNRFEDETHADIENDVIIALQNAITVLNEKKKELL
ncbi:hypothetical protein ACY2EP_002563 [Listeria innocua]